MSLQNLLIFVPTNLFRIFVNIRFLEIFLTNPSKDSYKIKRMLCGAICFFVTSAGYLLFRNRGVNMLTNIAGLMLLALTFYGNFRKKIVSVLLIYVVNMLSDVVVLLSFHDYGIEPTINELRGTMTVLVITVCEVIVEKLMDRKKNPTYVFPHWELLLLIPLCSAGMIHYCISHSIANRNMIVVMGMGLLIINVVSFYLYSKTESVYLTNMENELAIQTSEVYKQQLDVIMNTQEQIRSLQHDMKYHIRELLAMANAGHMKAMASYLKEMEKETVNPEEYCYSGNRELDGTLNYLLKEAHRRLKNVSVKIVVPEGQPVAAFDINVLLSNLLDNAMCAAEPTEEQYLKLEIFTEKSLMYIKLENSFHGEIIERNGEFISSKPDKTRHGYGLKNARRIVKKYNGTMDIHYKETRFCIDIMLYLSNYVV